MTQPSEEEVRAWLELQRAFLDELAQMRSLTHEEFARQTFTYRLLALLDAGRKDRERLDWVQAAAADALEIDNYGAGVGEPNPNDRVFLTWANSRDRIAVGETLRAAIDQARGA